MPRGSLGSARRQLRSSARRDEEGARGGPRVESLDSERLLESFDSERLLKGASQGLASVAHQQRHAAGLEALDSKHAGEGGDDRRREREGERGHRR